MIGLRSLALAAATLTSAAFGAGVTSSAEAFFFCDSYGHSKTTSYSSGRPAVYGYTNSSYSSGPAVYGYNSGDRRRGYRSAYRSNLGGPVLAVGGGGRDNARRAERNRGSASATRGTRAILGGTGGRANPMRRAG
jgi:hypothetical protein